MPTELLLDVTVRNPLARKYVMRAAHEPGHATIKAVQDKLTRYGHASQVKCAAIETYGRMHQEFHDFLHNLDLIADQNSPQRRRPRAREWAFQIQTALTRAVVHNILLANGRVPPTTHKCTPTTPHQECVAHFEPSPPAEEFITPPQSPTSGPLAQLVARGLCDLIRSP